MRGSLAAIRISLALSLFSIAASAVKAELHRPPPYTMRMTREDEPMDPAIERRYSSAFERCQTNASTTRQNSACYEAEFVRQDAVLNQVWHDTIGRLSRQDRASLLADQRNWIIRRDPFCKSIAHSFDGGTIIPVVYSNCRVEQTIRRTIWLHYFWQWQ